jgi:uncharacterized protein YdhG (YjbR/CyaY superfamily)
MISQAETPEQYIRELPEERRPVIKNIRSAILENLPSGFEETMSYGMIGYVVPHSVYPDGYHADPALPLPFINLASQKNHIALYHMALYSDDELNEWFRSEYKKIVGKNPDMGKSCIRFKKAESIPMELIGDLASKMTAEEWIELYENKRKNK